MYYKNYNRNEQKPSFRFLANENTWVDPSYSNVKLRLYQSVLFNSSVNRNSMKSMLMNFSSSNTQNWEVRINGGQCVFLCGGGFLYDYTAGKFLAIMTIDRDYQDLPILNSRLVDRFSFMTVRFSREFYEGKNNVYQKLFRSFKFNAAPRLKKEGVSFEVVEDYRDMMSGVRKIIDLSDHKTIEDINQYKERVANEFKHRE